MKSRAIMTVPHILVFQFTEVYFNIHEMEPMWMGKVENKGTSVDN